MIYIDTYTHPHTYIRTYFCRAYLSWGFEEGPVDRVYYAYASSLFVYSFNPARTRRLVRACIQSIYRSTYLFINLFTIPQNLMSALLPLPVSYSPIVNILHPTRCISTAPHRTVLRCCLLYHRMLPVLWYLTPLLPPAQLARQPYITHPDHLFIIHIDPFQICSRFPQELYT